MPLNRAKQLLVGLFGGLLLAGCVPLTAPATPTAPPVSQLEPLLAQKQYAAAVNLLETAAQNRPTDPSPLAQTGQIYLQQHRWLLAEDAFNRALARQPANALAVAGLAEVQLNQGKWPQAEELWQQAAALNPNLPGVFTGLGRTHLFRLDFNAARAAFLEQQTRQPDPEAQWYLAALAAPLDVAQAGQYLAAIPPTATADVLARRDYLLAALAPFDSQSPPGEVAQAVGVALAQAKLWPLAINALETARAQTGDKRGADYARTLAFLAHALAQTGRPALDMFEEARWLDPASALPLYFYGLYLRQKNALKSAELMFAEAIKLDPNNAAFYAELAQTKVEQGDFVAAEAQFEAAMGAASHNPEIQMLRVRFYGGRGYRLVEAGIPAAQAIIQTNPANAEAHAWLGWMYFLTGQPNKAAPSLRKAIALNPELVSARYWLGRVLEASAPEDAAEQYRRVVDLDTQGDYRDEALRGLQRLNQTGVK